MKRRENRGRWLGATVVLFALACSTRLPAPSTGPHPSGTTTYVDVPFPPPAARVEIVPPKPPDAGAVWVDGEWAWQGKRWIWQPGGWVMPPAGGYFAPWLVYRLDNGRLVFAPGAWHTSSGERLPNPVVLEAARNGLGDEATSTASPALSGAPASSGAPPASGAPASSGRPP